MFSTLKREELINCINKIFNFNKFDTVYFINNYDKNKFNFNKLACFDLDHTLIKPKSKRKLPRDSEDYEYINNVKETLIKLQNNNYHIIIFSNQSGSKLEQVITKIKNILLELLYYNKLQISVFIATKDDYYRKPHTGMFELFLKLNNLKFNNLKEVFYCGDAAGRNNDFSCSDYAFSHNLSLKYTNMLNQIIFYVPEELFLKQKIDFIPNCKDNPQLFINNYYKYHEVNKEKIKYPYPEKEQEIIIMCGLPGSGKSKIANDIYSNETNYIIISQDIYKTRFITIIKQSLKKKLSVVVDNTNIDIKNRELYVKLSKEHKIPLKCIYVSTPLNLCKHLNDMRVELGKGTINKVPDIAYNVLNKKYTKPEIKEGFDKIFIIPFTLPNIEFIHLIPKEFYYIYNNLII